MLRNRKKALGSLKNYDAFPKISEKFIKQTVPGGTLSLICLVLMAFLIIWETTYYLQTKFTFKFKPDISFNEKLSINLDITIAMPCSLIGADVLDVTGQHIITEKTLKMENTWFELDTDQQTHFSSVRDINSYLREEYHSIHQVLWKNGYISIFGDMPSRRRFPKKEKDACKISGLMVLNKVSGNLHVTAGKSILLPNGHAHLAVFMNERDYNFSHRIEKLSFGDHLSGIIHPLEGDEEIAETNMMTYQYFITVVPTKINTYRLYGSSYQYSVSQQKREISHDKGSHGTPGIFFKYDFSALQVEVREEHDSFLGFITRLIGILGGVFTCSGLMHRIGGVLVNCIFCRLYTAKETKKVPLTASLDVSTDLIAPLIATIPAIVSTNGSPAVIQATGS